MKGLYYNDIMRALAATDVDLDPEISTAVEELALAAYKLAEACSDYGGVCLNATLSFFEPEDTEDEADPQPAPVETPRKFEIGDTALVLEDGRSNYNCTVTIAEYTPEGYPLDQDGNSYRESELRLIRVGNPGLRPFESDLS